MVEEELPFLCWPREASVGVGEDKGWGSTERRGGLRVGEHRAWGRTEGSGRLMVGEEGISTLFIGQFSNILC